MTRERRRRRRQWRHATRSMQSQTQTKRETEGRGRAMGGTRRTLQRRQQPSEDPWKRQQARTRRGFLQIGLIPCPLNLLLRNPTPWQLVRATVLCTKRPPPPEEPPPVHPKTPQGEVRPLIPLLILPGRLHSTCTEAGNPMVDTWRAQGPLPSLSLISRRLRGLGSSPKMTRGRSRRRKPRLAHAVHP